MGSKSVDLSLSLGYQSEINFRHFEEMVGLVTGFDSLILTRLTVAGFRLMNR